MFERKYVRGEKLNPIFRPRKTAVPVNSWFSLLRRTESG
jgi:hypothetical protein